MRCRKTSAYRSGRASGLVAALVFSGCILFSQDRGKPGSLVDPELERFIQSIKAVDNHAHPVLPPPGDLADRDFDALPVDNMEPETDTVAWRPDNPQLPAAWAALWEFKGTAPLDKEGMVRLQAARANIKLRERERYDEWVLDRAGIETMFANRVSMGPGVAEPRFRWVPYADALLFPLDNAGLAKETPDRAQFFPLEDQLRGRYLKNLGLTDVPATLPAYLRDVVTATLESQKAHGAVAEKFEIAYLRNFDFSDPTEEQAGQIYARWVHQARPDSTEYKVLQDYLLRYIARECGRLGMAVHLHTMAGGGGYFGIAGANPLLLEPLFNDPRLRKTRFVLLHGGWPFVREAGALLQKPNVYLDLSQETLTFSPVTLANWLREWLETYPDKVLFGTDGYPLSQGMGWEESTWVAAKNGRRALSIALTAMLRDEEIDRKRAEQIATSVMRGTAGNLYSSDR